MDLQNIPYDKRLHFICGFALSLLGLIWFPLVSTGFIAGVLKEIWDYFHQENHTPDWYHIWWTWGGAAFAFLLLLMMI